MSPALTLRPDQEKAVDMAVRTLKRPWPLTVQSMLGIAHVRYGKTIVGLETAHRYLRRGEKLIIVSPSIEVVRQWANTARTFWGHRWSVGIVGGGSKQFDCDVTCATIVGYARHVEKVVESSHKLLIFDEAHRSLSPSGRKITSTFLRKSRPTLRDLITLEWRSGKVFYLTATPTRSDGQLLTEEIQATAFQMTPFMGRMRGILVKPYYVQTSGPSPQEIVNSWLKHTPGQKTIAFVGTKAMSDQLASEFRRRGVRAESVTSDTPQGRRKAIVDGYRDGGITVVCNARIFTEGVDVNNTQAIILAKHPKTDTPFIQRVGRAMGSNGDDKDKATIYVCEDPNKIKLPERGRLPFDIKSIAVGMGKTSVFIRAVGGFIKICYEVGTSIAALNEALIRESSKQRHRRSKRRRVHQRYLRDTRRQRW